MKLEQAARQALEALEKFGIEVGVNGSVGTAITALREALAEQAKHEPVLWGDDKFAPHERPQKPEKCANGCPPLQVCDYCQTAEQAEQEPVAVVEITYGREPECYVTGNIDDFPEGVFKLYAAPIRTKDLTDDELAKAAGFHELLPQELYIARAVIQEYRRKNGIV